MHSLSHIYFDTRHKNHKPILNIIINSNIPFYTISVLSVSMATDNLSMDDLTCVICRVS